MFLDASNPSRLHDPAVLAETKTSTMRKVSICVSAVLLSLSLASPVLAGNGQIEPNARPVKGEYIVVLENGVARRPDDVTSRLPEVANVAADLAFRFGGEVGFVYEHALQGFSIRLPEPAARALAANPAVSLVEESGIFEAVATQSSAPWGLDRIDQRSLPLNGTYVYTTTAPAVHVFVLDTGLRITHSQFTGRVGGGYTAINDGQGLNDCHGHGTHVAGSAVGTTYGVAKGSMVHPVRVLNCAGNGTTAEIVAGINWVTSNSHLKPAVANMSLRGPGSTSMDTAVRNSIAAGITYVVASGNDYDNACNWSPGRVTEAITVGGTQSNDVGYVAMNYGTCVDILGPAKDVLSAYHTSNSATATLTGTSMASPHVAGAAALYLQANQTASPASVQTALINNSTKNKLTSIGTGTPNRLVYVGAADAPPSASFTYSCSGLSCTFNGGGSSDDNGIVSYAWTFGDGTTGSGVSRSKTYSFAGTYSVRLTVTDTIGQTASQTRSVTVQSGFDPCVLEPCLCNPQIQCP